LRRIKFVARSIWFHWFESKYEQIHDAAFWWRVESKTDNIYVVCYIYFDENMSLYVIFTNSYLSHGKNIWILASVIWLILKILQINGFVWWIAFQLLSIRCSLVACLFSLQSRARAVNSWSDPIWTRSDLTRPENKWIGYGFNYFDPNRIGSGSG
jgi:hypothetical protein